ncbi:MAG: hypothetical protein FD123_953 [Bacteroidetes bacterium]|nr:MAG: hypothetical protein FD123_953 [Bacteroidota bacterium]
MKQLLIILLATWTCIAYGQDKGDYVQYNKVTEVTGTPYVIASVERLGKVFETKEKYLLFINTKTTQTKRVDFLHDAYIQRIEQFRADSLGINKIIVSGQTLDTDGKDGIDYWKDPQQVIVLSADGQEKVQLTDSSFFVQNWSVNKQTGTIVITGHYDTNKNKKYDKTDKNEIVIYDLKTLKLIGKI